MLVLQSDVVSAFRSLDPQRLAELPFEAADDFRKGVRAWEALSRQANAEADALLASLTGDGTLHPADLAFIRAFRHEIEGEYAAIVSELQPHLANLDGSIQNFRLYLRTADAMLKLRAFSSVQEVLEPLTRAPGRTGTLEAMFIILQGMMSTSVDKERLIEHVALIDGLLEKGFRLTESDNVVFYATWLEHHKIEPPIAPLLNAHAAMVEAFRTDNRELITTLLVMGDRHKAACAVRAAGRNYARKPFPIEGIDIERVAYLFSSHEEHEAARQAILLGFPKSRINKNQNLWGPLMLASYYAGRWKETIEVFRDHRDELPRLRFYDNARALKAVCEFQLRRFPEALKSMDELGARFYDHTSGSEAVAYFLTVLATSGVEAAIGNAARAFGFKKESPDWLNEYATTALTQLAVHDKAAALDAWFTFLDEVLRPEIRADMLQRIGDMMVEWALPDNAETIAAKLDVMGETHRAALLRAFIACERGNVDDMEKGFARTTEITGRTTPEFLLLRARCRRRLGLVDATRADLETLLADEKFIRRHAAFAIQEGLLRESSGPASEIESARQRATDHIRVAARNGDEAAIMNYEMEQLVTGESGLAYLLLAREAYRREPESIEVVRLARKAVRSARAEQWVRDEAGEIQSKWESANLLLPKG